MIVCDVTLSVYPHRAGLKNMPGHGGNRTYDFWNTSPMLCLLSYAVRSVRVSDISELSLVPKYQSSNHDIFSVGVVYSGEYDCLSIGLVYSKGRRFDSHRSQAYFSSLPGVDIHSQ